ncbi:MAG: hypothetical protein QXV85_09435 [Candidatus Bathyarchaeia archaeon]
MKEKTKTWLLILVVLYLVGCVAGQSFNPMEWSFLKGTRTTITPTGVAGMFDMNTKGYNSLDISSVLTENSGYHLYWYAYRGGWLMLGKGAATIELTDVDGGYVYAVVKPTSTYYVDWSETKGKNPRVEAVTYEDVDNDGYKDFVFKINMGNIPKPATGNPGLYFYPYFLSYEKPSLNAPADITGIGTSKVTKYVEWYVYFANVKKAFAITKVELTINTTDTTKITLASVAIPNLGAVTGDMFGTPLRGTSSLTWTYSIGSNLYNANYIKYQSNVLNKFYFTTQVDCQLQSSDVLNLTITIYGLTDSGTLTTLTDSVILQAGS